MFTFYLRKPASRAGWTKSLSGMVALGLMLPSFRQAPAQQPWPLWEAYGKRFLDDQGRVIDRSANDRTTSEGEAYAMFFALVDKQTRLRGIYDGLKEEEINKLLKDINGLLKEKHQNSELKGY